MLFGPFVAWRPLRPADLRLCGGDLGAEGGGAQVRLQAWRGFGGRTVLVDGVV